MTKKVFHFWNYFKLRLTLATNYPKYESKASILTSVKTPGLTRSEWTYVRQKKTQDNQNRGIS